MNSRALLQGIFVVYGEYPPGNINKSLQWVSYIIYFRHQYLASGQVLNFSHIPTYVSHDSQPYLSDKFSAIPLWQGVKTPTWLVSSEYLCAQDGYSGFVCDVVQSACRRQGWKHPADPACFSCSPLARLVALCPFLFNEARRWYVQTFQMSTSSPGLNMSVHSSYRDGRFVSS